MATVFPWPYDTHTIDLIYLYMTDPNTVFTQRKLYHTYRYEKGTLPLPPYLGFEAAKLHLLLQQRTRDKVQLVPDDNRKVEVVEGGGISMREELLEHCAHVGSVIVYCNEALDELYHFILPLRAHYLHASHLKPLVIMLEKE